MKSESESGFTAIEAIVVLVLIAAIGLVAWHVHGRPAKVAKVSDLPKISHSKTFTDAAGIYQLTYPSNWKVVMGNNDDDMGRSTDPTFPEFIPNDATKPPCDAVNCTSPGNGFNLSSYKQSNPGGIFKSGRWLPLKKETINGYTAYYKTLEFNDIWINVFVVHDGYLLDFSFVEKSAGSIGTASFDDSRHLSAFNDLVRTIKFLK